MSLSDAFISELQHEAATTRKCLERIPEATFSWKPHEKSMTMLQLATHAADMTDWVNEVLEKSELNFAEMDFTPYEMKSTAELVEFFDKKVYAALEALKGVSDETFMENWRLRNGDEIYFEMSKFEVLRGMTFNHIIHHRGQLTVYLRMNDIPVPALYGPSADEGAM